MLRLFKAIQLGPGHAPEFPRDFTMPEGEQPVAYVPGVEGPEPCVGGDFVAVRPLTYRGDSEQEVESQVRGDAARLLFKAAADRNILVHDATAPGSVTPRLLTLLKQVSRRTTSPGTRVTDIYLSGNADKSYKALHTDLRFHAVDSDLWGRCREEFLGDTAGRMPEGTSEFCLAVATNRYGDRPFVMPCWDGWDGRNEPTYDPGRHAWEYEVGLGVLDARYVLLGAF